MKKKAEKQPYLYLRLIEMLLGILITAIGLSCMMKSQLGQTAITAFTQNLTAITGIKSGTVTGIRKPISENGCVSFQVYSSVPMVWLYYFMPILLKIHLRNWLWSYPNGCGWNFVYFEPE